MKVTIYKTVDVEAEAEVNLDDILNEFKQRIDEASEAYWRRTTAAVDYMTRTLAALPDEVIACYPVAVRKTIHERLLVQGERYHPD